MQKMRVPPHFSLISFVKVFVVGGIASENFPSPIYKAYGVFKLFGIFAVYCVGFILSYDMLSMKATSQIASDCRKTPI